MRSSRWVWVTVVVVLAVLALGIGAAAIVRPSDTSSNAEPKVSASPSSSPSVTQGVLQVRQVLFQETGRVQLKPRIRPGPAAGGKHATRDLLRVDCDLRPRPMKDEDNVILCASNGYRFGLGPSALPAAPVASATAVRSSTGDWVVQVTLDDPARQAFTRFTRQLSQFQAPLDQAAIVIDGVVDTAPAVMETINSGALQITGPFTEEEARALADSLAP